VPVIGIVQVGNQAMADRYTYIPLTGLFIIMAWGVPDLLKKWKYRKEILLTLSALIILCLSIITWKQVGYWQNSITLYDHTLKVTDYNWLIYNNRCVAYYVLDNYSQAIDDCSKAIEIKPSYVEAYNYLGNYKQAIEDYGRAIDIRPNYAEAYNRRGAAYLSQGNKELGCRDSQKACELGNCKTLEVAKGRGACR
jgi:tetratricopeptide (TPR) repeat protein